MGAGEGPGAPGRGLSSNDSALYQLGALRERATFGRTLKSSVLTHAGFQWAHGRGNLELRGVVRAVGLYLRVMGICWLLKSCG